ncbi:MAG: dimethylsulfoxide reductase subunit B [Candidatus Aminicenantes bacterium]|nr:dimethylsulfoxide reductase subunit B [Candidatus Aminicenantes bacterium]
MSRLGFFFDASACSGCKACQAACKDKNGLEVGVLWRRVYEVQGGAWRNEGGLWRPDVFAYNVSIACNHCELPICRNVCPTAAIEQREDGIVTIDRARCIGCRYCEWACPYGALQFDEPANRMTKCDFCADEIEAGRPPACVAACPMRALDFGDIEELRARHGATAAIFPLPAPDVTKPALVIKPHRDAARAEAEGAEVANWEEI